MVGQNFCSYYPLTGDTEMTAEFPVFNLWAHDNSNDDVRRRDSEPEEYSDSEEDIFAGTM